MITPIFTHEETEAQRAKCLAQGYPANKRHSWPSLAESKLLASGLYCPCHRAPVTFQGLFWVLRTVNRTDGKPTLGCLLYTSDAADEQYIV